jgi:hypothetical protein
MKKATDSWMDIVRNGADWRQTASWPGMGACADVHFYFGVRRSARYVAPLGGAKNSSSHAFVGIHACRGRIAAEWLLAR